MPISFLVDAGHELFPNPAAFRPFKQGPKRREMGMFQRIKFRIFEKAAKAAVRGTEIRK